MFIFPAFSQRKGPPPPPPTTPPTYRSRMYTSLIKGMRTNKSRSVTTHSSWDICGIVSCILQCTYGAESHKHDKCFTNALSFFRDRLHYMTWRNYVCQTYDSLITFNNGLGLLKTKSEGGFQESVGRNGWGILSWGVLTHCLKWSNCHASDTAWLCLVVV